MGKSEAQKEKNEEVVEMNVEIDRVIKVTRK
jgi:hypothetical protein